MNHPNDRPIVKMNTTEIGHLKLGQHHSYSQSHSTWLLITEIQKGLLESIQFTVQTKLKIPVAG